MNHPAAATCTEANMFLCMCKIKALTLAYRDCACSSRCLTAQSKKDAIATGKDLCVRELTSFKKDIRRTTSNKVNRVRRPRCLAPRYLPRLRGFNGVCQSTWLNILSAGASSVGEHVLRIRKGLFWWSVWLFCSWIYDYDDDLAISSLFLSERVWLFAACNSLATDFEGCWLIRQRGLLINRGGECWW